MTDAVTSPSAYTDEEYCYLTTTGRRTGQPHTIEIWFAVDRGVVYLMAGGRERSDWVRNLVAHPKARL
ncbi:MAG: nitroreductase/quinone reductase family protein, partial [Acidimicrobiia bacterium]